MYRLLSRTTENNFNMALICNSPQCIDSDQATVQTRSKRGFGLGYLTEEPLNPPMSIHSQGQVGLIEQAHKDYAKQLAEFYKTVPNAMHVVPYIFGYIAGMQTLAAYYLTKIGVELSKVDQSVYFYAESGKYQIHLDLPINQPGAKSVTGVLSVFENDEPLLTIAGSLKELSNELTQFLPATKHGMLLLPKNPYELSGSYFTQTSV